MLGRLLENNKKLSNGMIIPSIMLGSFQVKTSKIMQDMVSAAISSNCFGFDTSPSYGTENMLGKAIHEVCLNLGVKRNEIFISDKIDGWQMFKEKGEVEKYVNKSLKNLGIDYLDLLLIHWPFENYLLNTWKCLERMYKSGKVKSIGLCNVNIRILDSLIKTGIEILPHVIQNEISPLRVCEEEVSYFQNMGIVVQAYSPLCRMIEPVKESMELRELAKKYKKSIPQVILRWHIDRGIIPIFTSTKFERIKSNVDIFDFNLSDEDIKIINGLNQDYKIFPESYGCPGF
ncbi:aldo/keto reductase family protein [Clostridium isatidis]|uniref:aldo/keto reductase family protein n=1 Tax=Clostridium isatidis TaxID=182773 RepID=UPI003AB03101